MNIIRWLRKYEQIDAKIHSILLREQLFHTIIDFDDKNYMSADYCYSLFLLLNNSVVIFRLQIIHDTVGV